MISRADLISWLNEHPIISAILLVTGLFFTFLAVNIAFRAITGDWCP
jgi:hypothetical protein